MDCLEGMKLIPDKSIDCIVTSPPYNKGESKNSGKLVSAVKYDSYMDNMPEEAYQTLQVKILDEMFRILKDDGSIFYNHKDRYVNGFQISPLEWIFKTNLKVRQEIVWNRSITGNLRGWRFWQVDERVYWLQKPCAKQAEIAIEFAKFGSIWNITPEKKDKTNHPCAFPVRLVDRCVVPTCPMGGVILDPYMGSGTTAISAIRNKCHFIGFELSEAYIDIAEKRIKLEKMQPSLF